MVAIENDEIVGTVCLRGDGMTTHEEWKAWLSYLVVPEHHRGKGIGKELVKKAEAIAKEIGINELHLFTRLEDPKLYADLGWNMIGKEEYRGGIVSIMGKIVNPDLSHANQSNPFSFFEEQGNITSPTNENKIILGLT